MTETPPETVPEPAPFPWLPAEQVRRWLHVTSADDPAVLDVVEDCRLAAAAYCETQRPDLLDAAGTFTAGFGVVQAGVLATARLYARKGSPAGIAAYSELGPFEILRIDPDVSRLLGVGRYAPPAVG